MLPEKETSKQPCRRENEREKERALYARKCSKSRAYFDVQNPRDRLHKFCIFDAPPQRLFPRFARRGFRAQSTRKRNT
jgi:hypothetical protein